MVEPADTLVYMIAGFVIIFGAILAYVLSMGYRWRKYSREIRELEQRNK